MQSGLLESHKLHLRALILAFCDVFSQLDRDLVGEIAILTIAEEFQEVRELVASDLGSEMLSLPWYF